jgi:hypothetical protein
MPHDVYLDTKAIRQLMNSAVNRNELSSTRMTRHDFLYLRIGELPIHS